MKKYTMIGMLITSVLAIGITTYSVAADNIIPKVVLNNIEIQFPDAKPYINEDSRTMVPLRFVSEALGCELEWIESSETVVIKKSGSVISLRIGENYSSVIDKDNNTVRKELDTKAELKNERTMVPLRFISETLGAKIGWDEAKNTVIITDGELTATPAATSTPTPVATLKPTPASAPSVGRTISCSNTTEVQNALKTAKPGDTIIIKSGTYTGNKSTSGNIGAYFYSGESGTADAHITIKSESASSPAILQGTAMSSLYVLYITGDYWDVKDLKITNAKKGVMLDNSSYTTLYNCEVYGIGEEAIHLRDGSSYCVIESCNVHDAGLLSPSYGEGIYVGSDGGKWSTFAKECDYNNIKNCTFGNCKAEPIDIKEGTTGTIIDGCIFDGTGISGANSADSFMDVKGNNGIIKNNIAHQNGNSIIVNAFEVHQRSAGCGLNNDFYDNTVYMDGTSPNIVYTDSNATARAHNNTRSPAGNMYSGNVTQY